MKQIALALLLMFLVVALTTASIAASPTPTVSQQFAASQAALAKSKQTNRALRGKNADLQDQVSAQNAVIGDQSEQISKLLSRLTNQPDAVDVIVNRDPADQWAAVQAIWRAFPTLPDGSLCGFGKGITQVDVLTPDSYTFYKWSGC